MKRGGLGKGLDALLPITDDALRPVTSEISIDDIDPNPDQPRKDFDKETLEQLSESIREAGVLSPILVVQNGSRYRIVAGERRFRAARLAGVQRIPCVIRDLTTEQQMSAALIENLQREDLNPVEESAAIQSLMDECSYTQEDAAKKLGKSRSSIANILRIRNLPFDIQKMLIDEKLTLGHAKILAGITEEKKQLNLARLCVSQSWSVRKLEEYINTKHTVKKAKQHLTPELVSFQDDFRKLFGVKTAIIGSPTKGKITLTYKNSDELEHIFESIQKMLDIQ